MPHYHGNSAPLCEETLSRNAVIPYAMDCRSAADSPSVGGAGGAAELALCNASSGSDLEGRCDGCVARGVADVWSIMSRSCSDTFNQSSS